MSKELLFYRFGGRCQGTGQKAAGALDEVASVIDEVTYLLNTRSCFPARPPDWKGRLTVLEYGLADFSHLSPSSRVDAGHLACLIKDAIVAYEPRLSVVSVRVESPRPCRDALSAMISGYVRKRDQTTVPVDFPVAVGLALGL